MYHLRRIKVLLAACVLASASLWAQDTKIPISSVVATSEQSGEGANLAIDGNTETFWHSQWSWGPVFNSASSVDLTITLSSVSLVDYVRYIPRQDRLDQGCWGEVELFYCPSTSGTDFTSLGTFQLGMTGTTYDFYLNGMEGGVQCGQIKFTIRSGGNNHATAAEIEAYAYNREKLAAFAQYFSDDLYTQLNSDVTSSDGIADADVKALVDNILSGADDYKKFRVGEYEPYMTTATVKSNLKLSSQYNNYENPTGIYLEEGQSCYVAVSGIGDYPVGLKIKNWYQSEAGSSYSLRNGLNYITATTEGNVFVNYYTDEFEQAPNVKVHFINAPVIGYWDQETMTNEDWVDMLADKAADDNRIIITRSEHAQLAFPVSAWKNHCPDNVDSTMTLYQQVQWAERDILGLEKYNRQVKNRQLYYATNYGFMAAGDDGAYCNVNSLGAIMNPDSKNFDLWGVGHEWGHNNQVTPGFKWSGCGETTNNIPASWAQFHFTGNRDADGNPTYLRLEDETSGIDEYAGMRGGRMQVYFEEGLRKGVAWQLQDGADYHGASLDTGEVDEYDADGNATGNKVPKNSRNYDHFVKLSPFWQLNLWGTLAGKCPDIIPMVIESIRTTEDYGTTYNTNGKQQINWMKLACDVTQINLLPFFEKAGMLRPIHAYIEDYDAGWNIITEEMINELKEYVAGKGYPAFTEEINYINGHNYHIYRDNLKLNVTAIDGWFSGDKVTIQHSVAQNAVAFETYNADGELIRITMYGLGSDDAHSYTKVLYPSSEGANYIMAVGYDGTRQKVYQERDTQELQALIEEAEALMGEVGEVSGEYAVQKVNLSADNYFCNALYTAEGNDKFTSYDVLRDGKPDTYLHTDYSSSAPTEEHYVTIDLGSGNELTFFNLTYRTRESGTTFAPSTIVIESSNDNATWVTLREVSGLNTENDQENTIEKLGDGTPYRYIRMKVLATGSGTRYFVLSELGLSKLQYKVNLKPDYSSISEGLVVATYNAIQSAREKIAEGEEYTNAYVTLQKMYDALYAAKNTVKFVDYTISANVDGGGVVYEGTNYTTDLNAPSTITLTVEDAIALDGYVAKSVTLEGTTITVIYNKVYTVQVTGGGGNGGVTFGEQNYADGETFDAQQASFTAEDLTAIVPEGYTLKEMTVDHETGVISVSYAAIPLVDTTKYYTLACKATDHVAYIRDLGTSINGRSAEGSLFQFEAADEDNGYYIKSYVSEKYLNCTANNNTSDDAVVESEEKLTVWKMSEPSHTDGVVTLTAGYDKYLNNNGDAPTYLHAKYHNGGPNSDNACSLWTLTEGEPLDMSDLAALIDATNILIASCYTGDVLNYVNSAYVTEASLTTVRSVVADAQAKYDSKATVASEYAAAMTALQSAKETLSANIASAETEAAERAQLRTDLNTLIGETNELITLCGTTPGDATETLINEVSALVASAQTVADNTGSTADELTAATTALQAKYDVLNAAQQSTAKADLRTLIAQTEVLIDECGVIDYSTYPVETPIALQAKNNGENYWVSSNADHNHTAADGTTYTDGGGIAALVDNSESTYFHTRWGGDAVNESHYIQVDMGEGVSIQEFVFSYKPRDPSPAPTAMTIYGSNDGTTFEDELAIITSGLPAYNSGKTYTSDVIGSDTEYRYLRFTVTESNGPGKKVFSGYYFFGMLEFDLTSITYETDYHVESLNPNGSVTEEQLLEVFNAKMAAAELANSSYDKTALEAETASLQALYDALQVAYETKQVPVTLTTDHENPVLYTIKSKRGETKTVQYEPASSHMFSIAEASEGSAKQAFYFMAGDERTQVYVYPYAAGQQVLAADNTGNGAAKVFVEEKTASQAKQWTFEKETIDNVDYYSLKVVGGSTYFSHFGGGSNKMGFYIAKDEGSRMTFAETTIEGSGAYNSLKVYYDEAAKGAGSKIEGGEGVGYYPVAEAEVYNAAYDVATTVLSDNASDYAAYLAAYNTLLDANEALVINMPEEGKYYTIVSACSDHRNGQLMYATSENAIVFSREMTNVKPEALWKFTAEGYLENLQTGCSVSTESTGGDHHKLGESPRVVSIKAISLDGQVLLTPEGAHPLHAQDNGSVVVGWNTKDENSASAWRIVEVDVTDVVHTVSIGQYEHAGLYLNYPVTIPDDVKAYYLDGSDISIDNGVGTLKMTLIEDRVLPARTAVILYAPGGGDYEFRYATEDVIAYDDNLLTGSTYQTYREAAPNYYYYVFGQNNGEIGLYKNGVKYDANGAEGNTHYKMSANKVLFAWDGATQSVSSFRFRFGGQTTGVEDEAMEDEAIIYDLFGRRLLEVTTSGLYIVNGEKCYIQVK